jgi:hypothetical protein
VFTLIRTAVLTTLFIMSCLTSVASEAAETPPRFGPWVWGLSGGVVEQLDTDLSDAESEMGVTRSFAQASLGYAWDRNTTISLSVGAGKTDYDFSPLATIDGQQPWGKIENYSVSVPIRFAPSETTNVILIPSVRTSKESGASSSEGRTEGIIGGMSWKMSDTLTLGPGLGWFSEVGGGSNVFPIIVVDWKITDKLSLNTGRGLAASQGPGLSLDYQLDKKWTFGLSGRFEKTRFSLDESTPGSGSIGEDRSSPLVATISYSPWPMTRVSLLVGAEFNGSLRLEDASARRLAQTDVDTAPIIGFSFSSRF